MPTPSRALRGATLLALALLALPRAASAAPCTSPARLADALLDGDVGDLPATARLAFDTAGDGDRARIEILVPAGDDGDLCLAVVGLTETGWTVLEQREMQLPPGAGDVRFLADLDLPPTAEELLAVAERPDSGSWAALPFDEALRRPEPGPNARSLAGGAWIETSGSALRTASSPDEPLVVRLVPPRERPIRGSARFDAVATTPDVERVVFLVDGEEVARDGVAPFAARLRMESPPRPQTVEVVAYDRKGREMGRDSRVVHAGEGAFAVGIVDLGTGNDGSRRIRVEVDVPPERSLTGLEVRLDDATIATSDRAPLDVELPATAAPSDFALAIATLDDGTRLEEALLLAPGSGEEVEVNLVELRTVVVDRDGRPVPDLPREAFHVRFEGRELAVERFSWADEVSLVAGLILDTSGSMRLLLHDTKKAAVRFLGRTLRAGDRGFLVDFDQNPRLLQPATDDVTKLFAQLGQLDAEGATAMYDAILFSLVHLEEQEGRPALVVLTDGDDRDSRWGPKHAIEAARRLGVPIYLIALGALDDIPRAYPKKELRRVTEETGGRVFFVDAFEQLDAAYDRIGTELRNQYVLGVYTERELDADELDDLQLTVDGDGLEVRLAVTAER